MRLRSPPIHDRLSQREPGLAVHELRLELIEQHLEVDRAIVNGVAAVIDVLRERVERHQRNSSASKPAAATAPVGPLACWPAGLSLAHPHFAEHARFHVEKQVAVIRPSARARPP